VGVHRGFHSGLAHGLAAAAKKLGIPNVSPLTFPFFNNIGYRLSSLGTEQQMLEEMTLHGLDVESCRKLAPNLHEKEFLKIYKLARGSPLEIKLLSDQADEHAGHEELTPEEMALLRYLRLLHERRVR
jgi:hypothetical protein